MSQLATDLEAILCAAYREQAELYAEALELCTRKSSSENPPAAADDWLPQLAELLGRVAEIEKRLDSVKEEWQRQGRPTGADLRNCLAHIADMLRSLAAIVDRTVKTVEAKRLQMMPLIEQGVRLRRMQLAYGRTGRAAPR